MQSASRVFGLGLQVDRPLAALKGLRPSSRVDVRAYLGSMPPELARLDADAEELSIEVALDDNGAPGKRVWRVHGGRYLRIAYSDGTTVVVDHVGERIWATWSPAAGVEDTAAYVLGPILALVLRLRGTACLHASAVAIAGKAIAFVGPSGRGKSSTAAAFARMGYPILTDDIVALREVTGAPGEFHVEPAYPRLNLWPESSRMLFGAPDALPRITPGWDKQFLDLSLDDFRFQHEALPLAAVYLLEERSHAGDHAIEELSPREALINLLSQSHGSELVDAAHRAREFDALSRLVRCVKVRRLIARDDPGRIGGLCEALLEDLRV